LTSLSSVKNAMAWRQPKPARIPKKIRFSISGTQQREMLSSGADIPKEFSRPEVVEVLRKYYNSL
jgi:sulfate adenylyltransferase